MAAGRKKGNQVNRRHVREEVKALLRRMEREARLEVQQGAKVEMRKDQRRRMSHLVIVISCFACSFPCDIMHRNPIFVI